MIAKYLASEGIKVSRKGVAKFLKRFLRTGRQTRLNPVTIFIAQGTIARQAGDSYNRRNSKDSRGANAS